MKNKYNQFGMKLFPDSELNKLERYFKDIGFEEDDITDLNLTENLDGWVYQHKNGMIGQLSFNTIDDELYKSEYLAGLNSPESKILHLIHEFGGDIREELFGYITNLERIKEKRPLMAINRDIKYGGFDFSVNGSVTELSHKEMDKLRSMIVVAIGSMEDMWRREQERKINTGSMEKSND